MIKNRLDFPDWASFKSLALVSKKMSFDWLDKGDYYDIWTTELGVVYAFSLTKDGGVDQTDFDDNWKAKGNTPVGVATKPFALDSADFEGDGFHLTCTAGQTTTYDFKLVADRLLNGGQAWASGADPRDYLKVCVIDIDNILGYGPNTVLKQYLKRWGMPPDTMVPLETPQAGKVLKDLYIRSEYVSYGAADVELIVNFRLNVEQ